MLNKCLKQEILRLFHGRRSLQNKINTHWTTSSCSSFHFVARFFQSNHFKILQTLLHYHHCCVYLYIYTDIYNFLFKMHTTFVQTVLQEADSKIMYFQIYNHGLILKIKKLCVKIQRCLHFCWSSQNLPQNHVFQDRFVIF